MSNKTLQQFYKNYIKPLQGVNTNVITKAYNKVVVTNVLTNKETKPNEKAKTTKHNQ
jgi:hypothetical protein